MRGGGVPRGEEQGRASWVFQLKQCLLFSSCIFCVASQEYVIHQERERIYKIALRKRTTLSVHSGSPTSREKTLSSQPRHKDRALQKSLSRRQECQALVFLPLCLFLSFFPSLCMFVYSEDERRWEQRADGKRRNGTELRRTRIRVSPVEQQT